MSNIITAENYSSLLIGLVICVYILANIAVVYKKKYYNLCLAAMIVLVLTVVMIFITLIVAFPYIVA